MSRAAAPAMPGFRVVAPVNDKPGAVVVTLIVSGPSRQAVRNVPLDDLGRALAQVSAHALAHIDRQDR
jgi:DNA-binding IclR family transcriptional regulator